jgi:S-formylglutathione hydrolase FrmB
MFGVTDPAILAFVEPRLVTQPWRTLYQPVVAPIMHPDIPVSYVVCMQYGPPPFTARLAEMQADAAVQTLTIDTSHHLMLTALEETMKVLVDG